MYYKKKTINNIMNNISNTIKTILFLCLQGCINRHMMCITNNDVLGNFFYLGKYTLINYYITICCN